MPYTTIQISKVTRQKLGKLKLYKKATYDEIIGALISLVPEGDDEGEYTEEFRASLLRGLIDIKAGRTYTTEEVRRKLGV
jgi:predicted transcriptional regulator